MAEQATNSKLEAVEDQIDGLPVTEEQRDRDLRTLEKQRELEQKYMRVYTDYTLTILEFLRELDLEKHREWNSAMKHALNQKGCERVLWACDLDDSRRVLVLLGNVRLHLSNCKPLISSINRLV